MFGDSRTIGSTRKTHLCGKSPQLSRASDCLPSCRVANCRYLQRVCSTRPLRLRNSAVSKSTARGRMILVFVLTTCAGIAVLKADDSGAVKSANPWVLNIAAETRSSETNREVKQDVALESHKTSSSNVDQNRCGNCDDACCCCCGCDCGPCGQFWVREEYVNWWARGGHVPALVVTSPTPD